MSAGTNSSLSSNRRQAIYRILFAAAFLLLCTVAENSAVQAQIAPKPPKKAEPTAAPKIHKVHTPRTRSGSPEDSYNFLVLGDEFWEKGRWNAAEAAYRESVRLWSGSQANAALKELHEATRVK